MIVLSTTYFIFHIKYRILYRIATIRAQIIKLNNFNLFMFHQKRNDKLTFSIKLRFRLIYLIKDSQSHNSKFILMK